jgi:MFS transporter, PAT family, beta-lactamase induction signal transducer AmpG
MTAPEATSTPEKDSAPTWRESLAVYLQPRVLIVLLLGFSSGLPLALSGSTLLVWMCRCSRARSAAAAAGWCFRNCC